MRGPGQTFKGDKKFVINNFRVVLYYDIIRMGSPHDSSTAIVGKGSRESLNTDGDILNGRVPHRSAILHRCGRTNDKLIQKYKGLLVKVFEEMVNQG